MEKLKREIQIIQNQLKYNNMWSNKLLNFESLEKKGKMDQEFEVLTKHMENLFRSEFAKIHERFDSIERKYRRRYEKYGKQWIIEQYKYWHNFMSNILWHSIESWKKSIIMI